MHIRYLPLSQCQDSWPRNYQTSSQSENRGSLRAAGCCVFRLLAVSLSASGADDEMQNMCFAHNKRASHSLLPRQVCIILQLNAIFWNIWEFVNSITRLLRLGIW